MQPVKMNDELIQGILQEFYAQASALGNLQADKFSFNKNFSKPAKDAVEVNFTLEAYHEMCALIDHFSTEVAWHGLVNRIDKTHFQITKILVYPQQVTGATVNTDQEKYTTWLYELDDESFNTLRFQGHSHVNMSTSPSGVDMQNQWDLIDTLSSEDYYVFMIWNKRREYNVRVVDMADNVIYSGDDVKVTIGEADTKGFLEQAEALVQKPVTTTYSGYNNGYNGNYNGAAYSGSYSAGTTACRGGAFVGNTNTAAASTKAKAETKPAATTNPALKTVTGGAAPKIDSAKSNGSESNLMKYYQENPNDLVNNWNSSCYPYADAFQD